MVLTEAAVVREAGVGLRRQEVRIAEPRADEVLIRTAATGVCHTDVSWSAGQLFDRFPVVVGHETVGYVERVGADVEDLSVGDRVVVALSQACGHCGFCEEGTPMLCEASGRGRGRISDAAGPIVQGFGVGGFARHVVVEASTVIPLPDGVSTEVGAVMGCAVSTGLGAVFNIADVQFGSSVLVFGAGAVGLSVAMGAELAGATRIAVVDPNGDRRRIAGRFGATEVHTDLAGLVDAEFDYAFEAVGRRDTMEAAIESIRRGGTVTLIGAPPPDVVVQFNALDFVPKQKRILGCQTGNIRPHADFPRYFDLHRRGRLPLEELVTGTIPFESIDMGFAASSALRGLRTVITF